MASPTIEEFRELKEQIETLQSSFDGIVQGVTAMRSTRRQVDDDAAQFEAQCRLVGYRTGLDAAQVGRQSCCSPGAVGRRSCCSLGAVGRQSCCSPGAVARQHVAQEPGAIGQETLDRVGLEGRIDNDVDVEAAADESEGVPVTRALQQLSLYKRADRRLPRTYNKIRLQND